MELKSIRINKRSISSPVIRYTFTAHGREVELTLHPTNEDMASGQTPIWQLHNYGNKGTNVSSVKFNKVSKNASFMISVYRMINSNKYFITSIFLQLLNGIGQIWEDPEKHAAVLIRSTPSRQKFMVSNQDLFNHTAIYSTIDYLLYFFMVAWLRRLGKLHNWSTWICWLLWESTIQPE